MKLDDKVALITGAAQGIGFGIAKRFVRAGSRMAIADLNLQTCQRAWNHVDAACSHSHGDHWGKSHGPLGRPASIIGMVDGHWHTQEYGLGSPKAPAAVKRRDGLQERNCPPPFDYPGSPE